MAGVEGEKAISTQNLSLLENLLLVREFSSKKNNI